LSAIKQGNITVADAMTYKEIAENSVDSVKNKSTFEYVADQISDSVDFYVTEPMRKIGAQI
jgi:hypothetical protein